jgi:hypothetical protein
MGSPRLEKRPGHKGTLSATDRPSFEQSPLPDGMERQSSDTLVRQCGAQRARAKLGRVSLRIDRSYGILFHFQEKGLGTTTIRAERLAYVGLGRPRKSIARLRCREHEKPSAERLVM